MSLTPPIKVGKLQAALHDKAKRAPSYRFYALYDKVWRDDVLHHAWERCRANDGAPGVDRQSFEQIERAGLETWLGELSRQLREKRYRPDAVRRVMIPKADGKQRPLGIATIKDRVVQMAAAIVLEPIFEADLPHEQFGYRPERRAHDAVTDIKLNSQTARPPHTAVPVNHGYCGRFFHSQHPDRLRSWLRPFLL